MTNSSDTMLKTVTDIYWPGINVELREITDGHVHSTYVAQIESGKYILQRVNTHVFKRADEVLENIVKINKQLLNDDDYTLEVARLVPLEDTGQFSVEIDNQHFRCFTFIEGSQTKHQLEDQQDVNSVAKSFGQFSKAMASFDPNLLHITIPGFHDPVSRWSQFENACLTGISDRLSETSWQIDFIREHQQIAIEMQQARLPVKIAHNDPKLTNVLFNADDQPICVIDLDTVMPGSALHDFGDMVRSMAASETENFHDVKRVRIIPDFYHAIQEGFIYGAGSSLSSIELDRLSLGAQYIIFEQALRYLVDYVTGDQYYRRAYRGQNLLRAKNQIALLQSLLRM